MDRELIIIRLEMLMSLIEKTEPDIPDKKNLFTHHAITTMEMLDKINQSTNTTGNQSAVDPSRVFNLRKYL